MLERISCKRKYPHQLRCPTFLRRLRNLLLLESPWDCALLHLVLPISVSELGSFLLSIKIKQIRTDRNKELVSKKLLNSFLIENHLVFFYRGN